MTQPTRPNERLWIYVENWDRFQGRRDRPGLPWFRVYSDLASDDDWNDLSTTDRCLLIGIWLDVNRLGNGRVSANQKSLRSRHSAHKSSLESLVQAGFITLSTTKGAPIGHQLGVPEKKEKKTTSSQEEIENARTAPAENGRPPRSKKKRDHFYIAELDPASRSYVGDVTKEIP